MQGKQGRFTVTEDKRNWGGWDTWHYFEDGKQFEEGSDKKGKTVWIVQDVMHVAAPPVWEEEFSKKSNGQQPQCIASHITQLQTTA